MFTVVPRPEIIDRRPGSGEPVPTIIDHRQEKQTNENSFDGGRKNGQSYQNVKEQRDTLILSEFKYKRRIEELEKENKELLKVYEPTFDENKRLKSHLLHGPDAQRIKKLKEERGELLSELEIVKQENAELSDRVQELEKMFVSERDYYREKKWREAIERGRKRREEKDAGISVQGPFPHGNKPKHRNLKTVKDEEFENQDERDLHIDTLEKETQILLNKIRQIKQNKETIDYVHFIGKGAVTRNAAIANAINEKLTRDMIAFEERLDSLRKKARSLSIDTNGKPIKSNGIDPAEDEFDKEKKSKPRPSSDKVLSSRKARMEKIEIEKSTEAKSNVSCENKVKNYIPVKEYTKTVDTSKKARDKKSSSTKISSNDFYQPNNNHPKVSESVTNQNNQMFKNVKKVTNEEMNGGDKITKVVTKSFRATPNNSPDYTEPIEEHWHHLAFKLNATEKYGQSRELRNTRTHRDIKTKMNGKGIEATNADVSKMKRNFKTPVNSDSAKRKNKLSQEEKLQQISTPVSMVTTLFETDESLKRSSLNSGKSQESISSRRTSFSLKLDSQTRSNQFNNKSGTDVVREAGEGIRYIHTQHSLDTSVRVKYTGDQTGRYSNGPEPIRRKKMAEQNTNGTGKLPSDNEFKFSVSAENDTSTTRKESAISKDWRISSKQTMKDELQNTKDMSAYDEVLAEVKKQYKEQSLASKKQILEPKSDTESKHKKQAETAWQQKYNKHREDQLFEKIEFKSDGRTLNDEELSRVMGNGDIRPYNRD